MTTQSSTDRDQHVIDALDEYLAAQHAGQPIAREDFLARHPDLADELARYLDNLALLDEDTNDTGDSIIGGLLGDFRILREIGRGGMGVVYEARANLLGTGASRPKSSAVRLRCGINRQVAALSQTRPKLLHSLHHPQHRAGLCRRPGAGRPLLRDAIHRRPVARRRHPRPPPQSNRRPSPRMLPCRMLRLNAETRPSSAGLTKRTLESDARRTAFCRSRGSVGSSGGRGPRTTRTNMASCTATSNLRQSAARPPARKRLDHRFWARPRRSDNPGITMTGDRRSAPLRYMSPEQAAGRQRIPIDHPYRCLRTWERRSTNSSR